MNWRDLLGRDDLPVPDLSWDPVVEHDAFFGERQAGRPVDPTRIPDPATVRAALEQVVGELLAEYPDGTPVADLNGGACEDVAYMVQRRLDGVDVLSTPFFDDPACQDAHIWIRAGEFHFDAETLDGVRNWRALPIFRRNAFVRSRSRPRSR